MNYIFLSFPSQKLQLLSFCNVILIVFAVEPEILEGKREKKITQRLDLMSKPKEKPKIESTGTGAKLGDIVRINHSIGKLKAPLLKPLHKIVYDRPGTVRFSFRINLTHTSGPTHMLIQIC